MPRQTWTSQSILSPKQRRRDIVDIIAAGLVRMPEGLNLTSMPPKPAVSSPFEESAESSPPVADRT